MSLEIGWIQDLEWYKLFKVEGWPSFECLEVLPKSFKDRKSLSQRNGFFPALAPREGGWLKWRSPSTYCPIPSCSPLLCPIIWSLWNLKSLFPPHILICSLSFSLMPWSVPISFAPVSTVALRAAPRAGLLTCYWPTDLLVHHSQYCSPIGAQNSLVTCYNV